MGTVWTGLTQDAGSIFFPFHWFLVVVTRTPSWATLLADLRSKYKANPIVCAEQKKPVDVRPRLNQNQESWGDRGNLEEMIDNEKILKEGVFSKR